MAVAVAAVQIVVHAEGRHRRCGLARVRLGVAGHLRNFTDLGLRVFIAGYVINQWFRLVIIHKHLAI